MAAPADGTIEGTCPWAFIAFIVLGIVAAIFGVSDDEKIDEQYTTLVSRLDSLKKEPITIENYAQKEATMKDLIWVEVNEYSSHEKKRKEAFDKLYDNYLDQLSTFYALHNREIDRYNGYTLHDLSDADKE